MEHSETSTSARTEPVLLGRSALLVSPLILVLAYPYLLKAFHRSITPDASLAWFGGALLLLGILSVPLFGLLWAHRLSGTRGAAAFQIRARQLAYFTIAVPPLFVFISVTRGLLGLPLSDEVVWGGAWLLLAAFLFGRGHRPPLAELPASTGSWRVMHGVSAAIILLFIVFHLSNHSMGLGGARPYTQMMEAGRMVYRVPIIEFALVALLLLQVASGLTLAWRWSERTGDTFRVLQIGSGIYLSAFIVTHLNSALISARAIQGIDTDWAWATGGADGLIYGAWTIRLLPHYAFGVFFVLSHLSLGLRQVLIAHNVDLRLASRICILGIGVSLIIAAAIMAGLLGVRL